MSQTQQKTNAPSNMTPSNVITIIRILLVPVFVAALLAPWPEWFGLGLGFGNDWKAIVAAGIFVLISATDWLDGYLARSRNEITDFGKFMDPLADKILVAAALISLVELGSLPTWVVLVILSREFIVSGVRMLAASKGTVIAASMLGKFKTVFQMIAIVLFVVKESHMIGAFDEALSDTLWVVSWIIMLIALGLTIASMIDYLYKARDLFTASITAEVEAVDIESMATRVIESAIEKNKTLAVAESLTGGLVGAALTAVPGSSAVFRGGVLSYVNEVKHNLLSVDSHVLETDGAVSKACAMQMADGARSATQSDIAISLTGIAGPTGAEPGKPVGTVWMGFSTASTTDALKFEFSGERDEVRGQAVHAALEQFLALLSD